MESGDLKGFYECRMWISAYVQHPVLSVWRIESIRPIPSKEDWFAAARV
jgi:hypothetical protein